MYGGLFAHAVFTVSLSLMIYVLLLGRGEGMFFPSVKLSTNEDGRWTSGDAPIKLPKADTKSK